MGDLLSHKLGPFKAWQWASRYVGNPISLGLNCLSTPVAFRFNHSFAAKLALSTVEELLA